MRIDVLEQLRSVRPVAVQSANYSDLWDRIVASPGDETLAVGASPRRPHDRRRPRRIAALASAAIVVLGGGAALAAGVDPFSLVSGQSPTQLFQANPAWWNQNNSPNYKTPVIASSVTNVTTVNVPHVGAFQFWAARTTDGRYCLALRGPDGLWAGTGSNPEQDYDFGGALPGCGVTSPETSGFMSDVNWIGPPVGHGNPAATNEISIIVFGIVDLPGAATVTETTTGTSGPVFDGRYFALVLPPHSTSGADFHLEALDSDGAVINAAAADG